MSIVDATTLPLSLPAVHATDTSELADGIAVIVDRLSRAEFPAVLPTELLGFEVDEAAGLLGMVLKADATEIQSYISKQFALFRESETSSESAMSEASWCRSWYYVHLRQFLENRSKQNQQT